MQSYWKLPPAGRCESHQCSSTEVGQCTREGKLYFITSEVHTSCNTSPWEQYSCEEALEIDTNNHINCVEITGE